VLLRAYAPWFPKRLLTGINTSAEDEKKVREAVQVPHDLRVSVFDRYGPALRTAADGAANMELCGDSRSSRQDERIQWLKVAVDFVTGFFEQLDIVSGKSQVVLTVTFGRHRKVGSPVMDRCYRVTRRLLPSCYRVAADTPKTACKPFAVCGAELPANRPVLQRVRTFARLPAVVETAGIEPASAIA
jgi:hypothetical protein